MLHITILAVGALKDRHWQDAAAEYKKRLAAFCKLEVVELPEYRLPQNPSPAEIQKCIAEEGKRILEKTPRQLHCYQIALCIEGGELTSEALAARLTAIAGTHSRVVLVIGGSRGLADEVKAAADLRLSMSQMTFPHQLARVMLLEQLYRGFSIAGGGKYHK
jgi:23S rRNA (pseudouridine1915-N3)-methyltransferase